MKNIPATRHNDRTKEWKVERSQVFPTAQMFWELRAVVTVAVIVQEWKFIYITAYGDRNWQTREEKHKEFVEPEQKQGCGIYGIP